MPKKSKTSSIKNLSVSSCSQSEEFVSPQPYLGKFEEAPHFVRDNKHIIEGYRINYKSPQKIVKTLFMLHNETGNIWTHLIGFIILFFLIFEGIAYRMESTHVLASAMLTDILPEQLP